MLSFKPVLYSSLFFLLGACSPMSASPYTPGVLTLTPKEANLIAGESVTLEARLDGALTDQVLWTSSGDSVGTIKNGIFQSLTGVGGISLVCAQLESNPTLEACVTVQVSNVVIDPAFATASVTLDQRAGVAPLEVTATLSMDTPNPLDRATLDWGDGSPTESVPSKVNAHHTYTQAGRYQVFLVIVDTMGSTAAAFSSVEVR